MNKVGKNEAGVGHVGAIVGVVVLAAVGFAGWWVWKQHQNKMPASTTAAVQQALKTVDCGGQDKDLCKFYASFKAQKYSTIASTDTAAGKTTTTTYQTEGTDKYHVKMIGGDGSYESIGLANSVYTKASDGTWWKQTIQPADVSKYNTSTDSNVNFAEPDKNSSTPQPTYTKLGTEKCGDGNKLTCFKYQVNDPSQPNVKQYIWFDNQAYQLRRMQTVSSDSTSDATFSYAKVTISAPSPAKDLAPNQYLVPGQSEPVTVPGATGSVPSQQDIQNLLNQYQQ